MDDNGVLTQSETQEIELARSRGMAGYYPAIPNAKAQAENTLRAARKFLKHAPDCELCASGTAHRHGFPETETA